MAGRGNSLYPVIFRRLEDCYVIVFPDLPGCSSSAKTFGDAIGQAYLAIRLWMKDRERLGYPIPYPSDLCDIPLEDNEESYLINYHK